MTGEPFEVDLVNEIADAMCDETEFDLQTPPPVTERHKWVDAWEHAQLCHELMVAMGELSEWESNADPAAGDAYDDRAQLYRDKMLATGVVCWSCWEHMGEMVKAGEHRCDDGQGLRPACDDCHYGAQAEAAALVGP